jgi:hypothetical protein
MNYFLNEQYFTYIMARTSYIRWDDDDVRFVLDKHIYWIFSDRVHVKCNNVTLGIEKGVMVFNATFSNISVISWRSVLLAKEARENHRPAQVTEKLYHNVVPNTHRLS